VPSKPTIRKRQLSKKFTAHGSFYEGPTVNDFPTLLHSGGHYFDGGQITVSEGHLWPPQSKRFSGDVGGPFLTNRTEFNVIGQPVRLRAQYSNGRYFQYYGYLLPTNPSNILGGDLCLLDLGLSEDELNVKGAEAIARCSPTNSIANAATFLAEAHSEGVFHLPVINGWKERSHGLLHVAGSEYLNAEFGWLPFIEEISSFANAVKHAGSVLEQYRRDSGKGVRRQYGFPLMSSIQQETIPGSGQAIMSDGNYNRPEFHSFESGVSSVIRNVTRNIRFSGEFTYHLPEGDSFGAMLRHASEANKLLGTTVTPETLWELTPWSWAADWFSDAQEVITNFQNFEIYGLVMRYGYLMEETIHEDIYIMEQSAGLHDSLFNNREEVVDYKPVPVSDVSQISVRSVQKKRIHANPFGFGLEWADLSPTQLAIAAALGITRLL